MEATGKFSGRFIAKMIKFIPFYPRAQMPVLLFWRALFHTAGLFPSAGYFFLLEKLLFETKISDLEVISRKFEIINLQLAQKKIVRRKINQGLLITLCAEVIVIISAVLIALN